MPPPRIPEKALGLAPKIPAPPPPETAVLATLLDVGEEKVLKSVTTFRGGDVGGTTGEDVGVGNAIPDEAEVLGLG